MKETGEKRFFRVESCPENSKIDLEMKSCATFRGRKSYSLKNYSKLTNIYGQVVCTINGR